MKKQEVFATVAIVIIIAISIAFLFVAEPEEARTVSEDGVVTVEGEWRVGDPVSVTQTGELRYEIGPEFTHAEDPIVVTFDLIAAGAQGYQLYRWDGQIDMWRLLENVEESDQQVVFTTLTRLGSFGLFPPVSIEAPDFVSRYDALLEMAPADTVGYEIVVGVVDEDGYVLELPDKVEIGGCGGIIGHGNVTERSELEHEARVLVDDVETLVHFLFVGQWIVDESGCVEGEELESVL